MKKSKFNLVIDAIMFVTLMAVAFIGLLLKYVLIPGYKRNELYGKNVELEYMGMDRHDWGDIHFMFSMILTFLLVVHIILHWKQIVHIFKSMIIVKSFRIMGVSLFFALSLMLCLLPVLVNPTVVEREITERHISRKYTIGQKPQLNRSGVKNSNTMDNHRQDLSLLIYGSMTLKQVALKYNISEQELAGKIGIPLEKSEMRLGHLRKRYGFTMIELREFVQLNRKD